MDSIKSEVPGVPGVPGVSAPTNPNPKPKPPKMKIIPPMLNINLFVNPEENQIKWNFLWDEYIKLFQLTDIDYNINLNIAKKRNYGEMIKLEDCSYESRGAHKVIRKIQFDGESIDYALASFGSYNFIGLHDEIENHLEMLYLYYQTFNEYKWKFKIPKIYRRESQEYVMEFVKLNFQTCKFGKVYSHVREDILTDIGRFLGLYLLKNNKKFYDFELYYTENGEVYILDYGFTEKVNLKEIFEKEESSINRLYEFNESMYNGMIEILEKYLPEHKENFNKICKISRIEDKLLEEKGVDFGRKYMKYKKKYLKEKENKN